MVLLWWQTASNIVKIVGPGTYPLGLAPISAPIWHLSGTYTIVGIGAAARHILPAVAASLGTKSIFPANFEVGDALGAILMASASL